MSLILLSTFDTKRHTLLHCYFLLTFMIGIVINAPSLVAEVLFSYHIHPILYLHLIQYHWLSDDTPRLRRACVEKAVVVAVLTVLAVGFGVALCYQAWNTGGI